MKNTLHIHQPRRRVASSQRRLAIAIGLTCALLVSIAVGASPSVWLTDKSVSQTASWLSETYPTRTSCLERIPSTDVLYDSVNKRCGSFIDISKMIHKPGVSLLISQRPGVAAKLSGTKKAEKDLAGFDLMRVDNLSNEVHCRNLCSSDTRCEAYAYKDATRQCWLKSDVGRRISKPGVSSAFVPKAPGETTQSMKDMGEGSVQGHVMHTERYNHGTYSDKSNKCAAACNARSGCKASALFQSDCSLYDSYTSLDLTATNDQMRRVHAKLSPNQKARYNNMAQTTQCQRMPGSDIKKTYAINLNVCRALCTLEENCEAIDYSVRDCWLKSSMRNPILTPGACMTKNEHLFGDI